MKPTLIESAIAELIDAKVSAGSIQPVGGGDINQCFKVEAEGVRYFVKVNHAERFPFMFEREAEGLQLLREASSFIVPRTFGVSYQEDQALLVMEYLEPSSPGKEFTRQFAHCLAELHKTEHESFGLDVDNYIGSLNQWNEPMDDWIDFFLTQRIDFQLEMAIERGHMNAADANSFESLYGRLSEFFPEEKPSLLHGDLWSGNYAVVSGGKPSIFDPAVYYGHRYMDLGMMQLFGGFDRSIFDRYHEMFPLESNWEEGTQIANLYPLLVHVNLFGESYVQQVRSIVRRFT